MIGETVDHYRITEKLGEGGMGEVYLAEDTSLRRKVALKFLPAYLEHDETARKRFVREARSAAAIDHPYICKIYEVGEVDNKHFIVMEYVQGQELREKMSEGRLPLKESLRIASQTSSALEKAHSEGIVHRDLKPANIMITSEGHVKVMDFGLAKRMEREDEDITAALTREGTTLGTLAYMSPEQLKGKPVDTRSDIFSFGVVLYEMLTGVHPFRTGTQAETVNAILQEHPSALSRYTEDTSDILQHTVEKMLAKDVEERYQSIREVRTNLKKLTEKLSVSGVVAESSTPKPKMRLGAAVVSIVLVALVLVLYFYQSGPVSTVEAPIDSIAVLPFVAVGDDSESGSLADGIAASISSGLLLLERLKVKPSAVLRRYDGQEVDPTRVSDEQGVRAVLMGSVERRGDHLAVNVSLIDGRDNTLIWGQPYSREISGIFEVQEEISRQVVQALRLELADAETSDLVAWGTRNPEAYQSYSQGRYQWTTRFAKEPREAAKAAISSFERAVQLDPDYQEAYAELVIRNRYLGFQAIDLNGYAKARNHAETLIEIDPSTVLAHQAKALIHWSYDGRWEEAEREFERAAELNPNFVAENSMGFETLGANGAFLEWMGRREEYLAQVERRLEQADPLSFIQQGQNAWSFLWARAYDRTIEQARKTLALEPQALEYFLVIQMSYELRGMEEEAFETLLKIERNRNASEEEIAAIQGAFDDSGMEGVKELGRRDEPREWRRPLSAVRYFLETGDKDQALEWLEKVWQLPRTGYETAPSNPQLDPLRSDPRFEELLRKQNLPEEAIGKHLALTTN